METLMMESHHDEFIIGNDFFDPSVADTGFSETEIDSAALVRSDESDVIKKLFHELSEKSIELTSTQLSLNHTKLQLQALLPDLHQTKSALAQSNIELAKANQDYLLIMADLKAVSTFEDAEDREIEIEQTRGPLLISANSEIEKLTKGREELIADNEYLTEECTAYQQRNQALQHENEQLTGQLATRTIMYNAQMRKFHEEQRQHSSMFSDQERENIELRAKLQQLSEQYELSRKEKTELEISYREVLLVKSTVEQQFAEAEEARAQAEDDLNAATDNNRMLQATVDSLRGSDFDEIQLNFAREVESIRGSGRAAEEDLRRQVAELRRQTSAAAEEKERLVDETESLSAEVNRLNELLSQAGHSQLQRHVTTHQHQQHSLVQYSERSIFQNDDSISVLSQHSAAEEMARRPTVGGTQQLKADNHPLRQSTESTGSFDWSLSKMAEDRARDRGDGGDSHVLHSSQEGLHGIAFRGAAARQTADTFQSLLSVLDAISHSVGCNNGSNNSSGGARGFSAVADRAISQLMDAHTLDLSDTAARQELFAALDKLVKQLVGAVHAHLGEQGGGEGTDTHIHQTPEAHRRTAQHVSLESGTPATAMSSVGGSSSDGEKGDSEAGSLPRRYRSSGTEEDEAIRLRKQVHKLEKQLHKVKAENAKSKKLIPQLLHMLDQSAAGAQGQPPQHVENPNHPHHRTVRIHSEIETKSDTFTQHQTRDVSMSLESGDNISPAELEKQLQLLQNTVSNSQAERDALLQQIGHFREEVRQFEDLAVRNREEGRIEAAEVYESRIHALEDQLFELQRERAARDEKLRADALAVSQAAESAERLHELTARLEELQTTLDAAVAEKEALVAAVASKEAQISHHEAERQRHLVENEAAAAEVAAHKSHVDALRQSLIEHEAKVVELQGLLAAARHQLAESHDVADDAEKSTALQYKVAELEGEKDALIAQLQSVTQNTEAAVQDRITAYEQTIKKLELASSEHEREIGALSERVAAEKRHKVELEAELFQTNKLAELQQRRVATQEAQCQALQGVQEELHDQIDTLRRRLAAAEKSSASARASREGAIPLPPYVLQGQFQETVTSLQIQMEAVKNINTLVVENIRDRISQEDRSLAEREMHSLRLELEQRITEVNEQITRLREQQVLQAEVSLQGRQQGQQQGQDGQNGESDGLIAGVPPPAEPSVSLQVHNEQLQAEKAVLQQVQQRLHELELTNAQLVEHNMVLLRGALQHQQQHEGSVAEEKDRERDNGSVFSIDRSAYQSQIAQLSQQAAVLEQQRVQIDQYRKAFDEMEQQVQQIKVYYRAKLAKTKEGMEEKLRRQQVQFDKERAELVVLVNEECARIVEEVHVLFQQQQNQQNHQPEHPHAGHEQPRPSPHNTHRHDTGAQESRGFTHATPPVVPPPPPSHRINSSRPSPPTHEDQSDRELHAHFSDERHSHQRQYHQQHQTDSQMVAQHEEKRSSEYEMRHSEESSIPVRSSLTLTGPTLGASPARKPLNSKTAAIIAAHSRPPAGLSLPGPFTTPGSSSITRLLSSVTSLQSHVSGSSSHQGLTESVSVSVLAGPKPSYANPTVAFTSKHRSSNFAASQGSIHPPSSSGDINAGSKREKRSSSSSKRDPSASPPRRRGGGKSAQNTHSSERPLHPSVEDSQRTVAWMRASERSGNGNRGEGGGRSLLHGHQHQVEDDRAHNEQRERGGRVRSSL